MHYLQLIPDFYQSTDQVTHIGNWKTLLGLLLVLFATFVGVEIRLGNDDDDV